MALQETPVTVTCITNSHRAQSFLRSPHTSNRTNSVPFTELKRFIILLHPFFWDMTECHIPEEWNSHHTTVKITKFTQHAAWPLPLNSVHIPLLSNFKHHFTRNITVYDVAASFKVFWPKFWICFFCVPWIRKAKITFLLWSPVTSRP